MKSNRKPPTGPIERTHFQAPEIARQHGSMQLERFNKQRRQFRNACADVQTASTGR
jgi:hypothetical protein